MEQCGRQQIGRNSDLNLKTCDLRRGAVTALPMVKVDSVTRPCCEVKDRVAPGNTTEPCSHITNCGAARAWLTCENHMSFPRKN